ncbi:hypothetical protein EIN_447080 [Entamoeba invadens IP1]|uniref:Uncharacterized protein n=1 Tax=Entamoeba invadens IP1 TaxID=370355 RepID=L7FME5_ENTIV|nr:hypothetical protein EIN_447080 [Entamoeba invadens IP1]ELP89077.1 hypothetical protein EIN_447080 [Entamoeba invadens IP1]|eukprot:XP_004255848.1 hypothetical protein EIN_447080 [Entamoeba invadens IP1]
MVVLESVFLKNVILYIPTIEDVFQFILINNKCLSSVKSMYVNSYKLSLKSPIEKILLFFPNIETLYFNSYSTRMKKIDTNSIPIVEMNLQSYSSGVSQLFKTKWFPPKIRKMRIIAQEMEMVYTNYTAFEQLKELVITCSSVSSDNTPYERIICHDTLQKVTFVLTLAGVPYIVKLDFKKMKNTKFVIILTPQSFSDDYVDLSTLSNLPENVTVYTTFLYNNLKHTEFIGDGLDLWKSVIPNQLMVLQDFSGDVSVIEEKMRLSLVTKVHVFGFKENFSSAFYTEHIKINNANINLETCDCIKEIEILRCDIDELILPTNVEVIKINEVTGNVVSKQCAPREIIVSNYTGTVIKFSEKKLRNLNLQQVNDTVEIVGKMTESNANLIDVNMKYNMLFSENNVKKFVLKKDDVVSKEFAAKFLFVTQKEISFGDFLEDVDFSVLDFDNLDISLNEQNLALVSIKFGDVKKIDFNRGKFKRIEISNVDCVEFMECEVESLIMKTAKMFNFKKTKFNKVEADKIEKMSGMKKSIETFILKNK